ncbi:myo-inositol-1-phosphate synthase [Monoraphidium neglectum]|uniref:Myo-inositol-1-phosphate synthase n=1 Tax=Monoraphidium neglectum TaxID=145388 RepID=A0A0D2J1D7_9CHLO|nr:myo-inositol-1-phosphate synthase [Monoraphidium neglectum]KIY93857.1 myo-inositol-1-phosphate synthase [Monoraphidium neglectum]|eukprot:XP_013892877.1 myo-inositol-1-phosphate synthase [Monoraphidium neglectum]
MLVDTFKVVSPNVRYTEDAIESTYRYDSTRISRNDAGEFEVAPTSSTYEFAVDRRVPKLGIMLVGLGGNNGTTVAAGILANKHGITWMTKDGLKKPNYWGSLTQAATVRLGNYEGEEAR